MDNEGEHWNSYLTVIYSTLLGKGRIQVKLYNIDKLSPKAKVKYKARKITLVYNYPKSPKMNAFIERVNCTV